jgi:hypothetical protein
MSGHLMWLRQLPMPVCPDIEQAILPSRLNFCPDREQASVRIIRGPGGNSPASRIQLRTAKIDNSICGPGNFFDRKLTSDSDSAGPKTSESVENGFFPRLFGLAKILGRFCNTLHPF